MPRNGFPCDLGMLLFFYCYSECLASLLIILPYPEISRFFDPDSDRIHEFSGIHPEGHEKSNYQPGDVTPASCETNERVFPFFRPG